MKLTNINMYYQVNNKFDFIVYNLFEKKEEKSIGVKTLDRIAAEYVARYDNNDDSENPTTAHGFSYHNVKIT